MKSAVALTLALGMAFSGATNLAQSATPEASPSPKLKITEERYNPGICKPAVVKYYNDVKNAARTFDAEKLLKPEIKNQNPELYEKVLRDGDIIHMGAFGIDRFSDSETVYKFNKQSDIAPGTPEDRASGEKFFCENLYGYASALAAAVSMQTPVKAPTPEQIAAGESSPSTPTRTSFERYNVAACPAPVVTKFREITGKVMPDVHSMVDQDKMELMEEGDMSSEMAASFYGAKIRTGMIRTAQAGMVYAATEYADYVGKRQNLDEKKTHAVFCEVVSDYTESLEYFTEKHLRYTDPNKTMPSAPIAPKKEL